LEYLQLTHLGCREGPLWADYPSGLDITHVVGGLALLPFSFQGGVMLDDKAAITFFDWQRDTRLWHKLNGDDDGERFAIEGIDAADAIVTVSASYRVNEGAAVARVGALPIVRWSLPTTNTGNHWSSLKQQAPARQFLDTMGELKSRGVPQVHLFFNGETAAPDGPFADLGHSLTKSSKSRHRPREGVEDGGGIAHSWGIGHPWSP